MKIWRVIKKAVTLQRKTGHVPVVFKFEKDDSLAQLVEHNTFNVGVVGSSPTRITEGSHNRQGSVAFFRVRKRLRHND